MPYWTKYAVSLMFVFQAAFFAVLLAIVRSHAAGQDIAGAVGDLANQTSEFTNTVNIFNFVVVAMVVSFGLEKYLDYRKAKLDREEFAAARKALQDNFIAQQNLANQHLGLFLQAINTIVSLNGIVATGVESMNATKAAIDAIVDRALTSMLSERTETAAARNERDLIYNEYRRTFDLLHADIVEIGQRLRAAYPPLSPAPLPQTIGSEGVNPNPVDSD